jgi:site-specific DNA-cytosine methylase
LQTQRAADAALNAFYDQCHTHWHKLNSLARPLRYASDCTGADAPTFAFNAFALAAAARGIPLPPLAPVFKSEHADAPAAIEFLVQNFGEQVTILNDMHDRIEAGNELIGVTMAGERFVLPKAYIDVYFAGTDCRDYSGANRHASGSSKSNVSWSERESDTRSSKTLMQSIWTCVKLEPAVVVLENVRGSPMLQLIEFCQQDEQFSALYEVFGMKCNAADYYTPCERDRRFVVCVLRGRSRVPLCTWGSLLGGVVAPRQTLNAEQCVLVSHSEEVQEEAEHQAKKAAARLVADLGHVPASSRRVAPLEKRLEWRDEHRLVREALCGEIPAMEECSGSAWLNGYCARERELCLFLSAWISQNKPKFGSCFFMNMSEPTSHNRLCFPGIVPPMLRKNVVALLSTVLKADGSIGVDFDRHLLGLEHMFVLGFPPNIKTCGLTDTDLRSIAGNSMSVSWLVLLWSLILTVDFNRDDAPRLQPLEPIDVPVSTLCPHDASPFASYTKRPLPGLGSRQTNYAAILTMYDIPDVPQPDQALNPLNAECAIDLGDIGTSSELADSLKSILASGDLLALGTSGRSSLSFDFSAKVWYGPMIAALPATSNHRNELLATTMEIIWCLRSTICPLAIAFESIWKNYIGEFMHWRGVFSVHRIAATAAGGFTTAGGVFVHRASKARVVYAAFPCGFSANLYIWKSSSGGEDGSSTLGPFPFDAIGTVTRALAGPRLGRPKPCVVLPVGISKRGSYRLLTPDACFLVMPGDAYYVVCGAADMLDQASVDCPKEDIRSSLLQRRAGLRRAPQHSYSNIYP